ncbi:MAG: DUF2807 domain-containing protein [Patescibacteria group bacterium]|nr:DUF2807 domain-containing protein [Patescibacteria group bacterium]
MKKVANVNGTNVYSDKPGSISINGSRITFADGSSCDVRTKAVDNRGRGSIRVGEGDGSEAGEERVTKGPMRFSTTDLRFSNLAANIVVEVCQSGMDVTMSGPKGALEAIIAKADGSTLFIEGGSASVSSVSIRGSRGSSSVSVSGSVVGSLTIASGNVTVVSGSVSADNLATIMVKVPRGTGLTLDDTYGSATIGDVDGSLNVSTKCGGKINCGRMRGATIEIFGDTDVHISEINGPLKAQIMGSGDIRVMSGTVTTLNVQVMGTGDFRFGGVADTAMLSVLGSGDINVFRVKAKVIKQCLGSGDIKIG